MSRVFAAWSKSRSGGRLRARPSVASVFLRAGVAAALAAGLWAATVEEPAAQSAGGAVTALETHGWWGVFVDESGPQKLCFAASTPEKTVSSQTLRNRGEHFLIVTSAPSAGVRDEVSTRLGYPADAGRSPVLVIDGRRFTMFSKDGDAWLDSADVDRVVVDAMKRGLTAVVEARSLRGTDIADEYNLRGFTAAVTAAARLCQ